jgi:hypothetical protein
VKITDLDENILSEFRIDKPDPSQTLGIPRRKMPQINEKDYPEFLKYLESNGVAITRGRLPARTLKPVQKEFSDKGVMKALLKRKNEKPIIASSDNYIIDGHHRWLAAVNTLASVSVIRANVPVKQLLKLVHAFPKTYYKDIYDIDSEETPTQQDDSAVKESASAGGTSAGAVASVANPTAAKVKAKLDKNGVPIAPQKKNKNGTAKNALDVNDNIMGGRPVKR